MLNTGLPCCSRGGRAKKSQATLEEHSRCPQRIEKKKLYELMQKGQMIAISSQVGEEDPHFASRKRSDVSRTAEGVLPNDRMQGRFQERKAWGRRARPIPSLRRCPLPPNPVSPTPSYTPPLFSVRARTEYLIQGGELSSAEWKDQESRKKKRRCRRRAVPPRSNGKSSAKLQGLD